MRQINKKILWVYFIIPYFLMAVIKDENISTNYDAFQAVGGIFEPILTAQTTGISSIINTFGIMLGLFSLLVIGVSAYKLNSIEKNINSNKETINNIRADTVNHKIQSMEEVDKIEKWVLQEIKDSHRFKESLIGNLEKDIEIKVKNEIVSSSQEMLQNVETHAYKELSYKMENIKNSVEKRLFTYQNLIYHININKGLEYDMVLKEEIDSNLKLKKMADIQKNYNEINNITIPNLLSSNVKIDVIPALQKLLEEDEINSIIEDFIQSMIKLNIYTVPETLKIESILKKYCN